MIAIVLIGAPGAGKSSIAKLFVERNGFEHISTGDLIREKLEKDVNFREKYGALIKKGLLLGDEKMLEILIERLKASGKERIILDGYPRTIRQAHQLEELAKELGIEKLAVLYIKIDKSTAVTRLSSRRYCRKCGAIYNLLTKKPKHDMLCDECGEKLEIREDDKPEVVEKRFEEFMEKTKPLIEYYRSKGILIEIDGNCELEECYARAFNAFREEGIV